MSRPTQVNPILYNRLSLALDGIANAVEAEVEFVGRHLALVERAFAEEWDQLTVRRSDPIDDRVRFVFGQFDSIPAAFAAQARLNNQGVIEIRNIRIVLDPAQDR